MTSSVSAPLEWDRDDRAWALTQLRAARRRNRVANVDRFDAFYKAYVTAILAAIALYSLAGWFGDEAVRGAQLDRIIDVGPAYLGIGVALALAMGVRSGARGGPLAFERADVRHVLMAPVAREDAIRGSAWRAVRHAAFIGGAIGGALGIIALRRLPGAPIEWVAALLVLLGAVAIGAYGIGLAVSGFRLHRYLGDVLAFALLAWAVADAYFEINTSPFAWVAHLATWPLDFDPVAFGGLAIMLAIGAVGLFAIPGWSLEVAERRSRLVGQVRFAATMQDFRTVLVLQRQLSQETLRTKPRIRLPRLKKSFDRKGQPLLRVFARRSFHSLMRWSFFRFARLIVLALVAGFAVLGAWVVATPLLAVAGLALWLIALDLLEPLAQEADRPDRLLSVARNAGWVHARLIVVPAIFMVLLVAIGAIPVIILGNTEITAALLLAIMVSATVGPLGGAVLATVRDPHYLKTADVSAMQMIGLIMTWRLVGPPAIAILGLVPIAFAQRAWEVHGDIPNLLAGMTSIWYVVVAIGAWGIIWARYGGDMREKFGAQIKEAQDLQAEQAKEKAKKGTK